MWLAALLTEDKDPVLSVTPVRVCVTIVCEQLYLPMCVTMGDISDLDRQIEQLRRCELIKENEVKALCAKAR